MWRRPTTAVVQNTTKSSKCNEKVRPKDHPVAFRLDTRLDVDKASTSLTKHRILAKVRPKDPSVAFGLDTHSEVGKTSTDLSKPSSIK